MHKPGKTRANARISVPNYYWQRTALKSLSNKWIRDSKLLPFYLSQHTKILTTQLDFTRAQVLFQTSKSRTFNTLITKPKSHLVFKGRSQTGHPDMEHSVTQASGIWVLTDIELEEKQLQLIIG